MIFPGFNLFFMLVITRVIPCSTVCNEYGKIHFLPKNLLFDIFEKYNLTRNNASLFADLVFNTKNTS